MSEISLGCWTIGRPNWNEGQPVGWQKFDREAAVRALERALELGCNHLAPAGESLTPGEVQWIRELFAELRMALGNVCL